MDEFGCFEDTEVSYKTLGKMLAATEAIVFSWSCDKITAYVVHMNAKFLKLGVLPFGGNPTGSVWVSVLHHGNFFFNPWKEAHAAYVQEKLVVNELTGKQLALLLNGVFKQFREAKNATTSQR